MTHHTCPRCTTQLVLEADFHRDRTRKSGFFPYCKTCQRELHSQWYVNNRDTALKAAKDRAEANKHHHNKSEHEL
jgi:hypothetical protein